MIYKKLEDRVLNPFLYTIFVATDGNFCTQTNMKFTRYWITKISKRVFVPYIIVTVFNPFHRGDWSSQRSAGCFAKAKALHSFAKAKALHSTEKSSA